MIELQTLLVSAKSMTNTDGGFNQDNIKVAGILYTILILLEIILWIWAILRAIHCSGSDSTAKVVHLLFAILSPTWYIIFSYSVNGMCSK